MKRILFAWIGQTDLDACERDGKGGIGPIAQAAMEGNYNEISLLCNYSANKGKTYTSWLSRLVPIQINLSPAPIEDPTDLQKIYENAANLVERTRDKYRNQIRLTFHTSPGTPQMAVAWILLSASKFQAELIKSSLQQGVKTFSLPFEIAADYIPEMLKERDKELASATSGASHPQSEFQHIIYQSQVMRRVIQKAQRVALRSVPVLIEGASGTGKELLAKAIHNEGHRKNHKLIVVNCGAIPPDLVESELFGHVKGAFSGAVKDRKGHFEEAHNGTLFLDEIGEMPLHAQVKLLRVVQEGEILPVGASTPRKINVRIIAATNRNLIHEARNGRFREDLFYRLAVAVIRIPNLQERREDIELLIDKLFEKVNQEHGNDPTYQSKKISAKAKKLLTSHSWPGNIRELINTLHRTALWSSGSVITELDVAEALLPEDETTATFQDYKPVGKGIDIKEVLAETARHYLQEALELSDGNKSKAAAMLKLNSYQTFTNWMEKYQLE